MRTITLFSVIFLILTFLGIVFADLGIFKGGILILFFAILTVISNSIANEKEISQKKDILFKELKSIKNFMIYKKFINKDSLIALDDDNKLIAIKDSLDNNIKVHPYKEIESYEIIDDGKIIIENQSVIGRAIVGSVLAGGVGAIIGGLTAKDKEHKEFKNLDLKIKISKNKVYKIRFFDILELSNNTKKSIKINEGIYGKSLKDSLNLLDGWSKSLNLILENNNQITDSTS